MLTIPFPSTNAIGLDINSFEDVLFQMLVVIEKLRMCICATVHQKKEVLTQSGNEREKKKLVMTSSCQVSVRSILQSKPSSTFF